MVLALLYGASHGRAGARKAVNVGPEPVELRVHCEDFDKVLWIPGETFAD